MFLFTLYCITLTIELSVNNITEQANNSIITSTLNSAPCIQDEKNCKDTSISIHEQDTTEPVNQHISDDDISQIKDIEVENSSKNENKTITITNAIESKTIDYDYWGKRTPESFTIHINDVEVKQGETHEISKENKEFKITYSYSFVSGMYKGSEEITYNIDDLADQETLTFSWNETWRVHVSNATPIKREKVKYKQTKKEKKT